MSNIQEEYLLDNKGINDISKSIGKWAEDMKLDLKTALRTRLTAEELLMRISNHYGEKQTGTLYTGKRFGMPYIRFRYHGDPFNPMDTSSDPLSVWGNQLLANMGQSPAWSYSSGQNELMFRFTASGPSFELLLLLSLTGAIAFGLCGSILPAAVVKNLSDFVLRPLSDIFLGLLNTFAGLLIFLSVVNGTLGIGNAAEFGRIGKKMIPRFLALTAIGNAVALLMSRFVFALQSGETAGGGEIGESLLKIVLNCVPTNPVKPFYDGNSLQIVFLAMMISVVMLSVGERSANLRAVLSDSNVVIMDTIRVVCRLLPLYVFTSMTLQFWETGIDKLLMLWKPITATTVICLLFFIVKVLYTSVRLHVRTGTLIRKILAPMIVGFSTASSSSAFSIGAETCEKKLGISGQLTKIGVPIGCILYSQSAAIMFTIIACYFSESYGISVDAAWLITTWLLTTILACATPPVSGGPLACIGVMFTQLGIPGEAMALAATLGVILDFVCTGFMLGMVQIELVLQSDHLGMLDKEILSKGEVVS